MKGCSNVFGGGHLGHQRLELRLDRLRRATQTHAVVVVQFDVHFSHLAELGLAAIALRKQVQVLHDEGQ